MRGMEGLGACVRQCGGKELYLGFAGGAEFANKIKRTLVGRENSTSKGIKVTCGGYLWERGRSSRWDGAHEAQGWGAREHEPDSMLSSLDFIL